MNRQDPLPAPVALYRDAVTDCPVCGLGDAFVLAQHYDVCARCGGLTIPNRISERRLVRLGLVWRSRNANRAHSAVRVSSLRR